VRVVPSGFVAVALGDSNALCDEVEPLADVRRPEARSAQISRPDGVARSFHVSAYSIEPLQSRLARNLLAKHDWRLFVADEVSEIRPQVSFVRFSHSFASTAKRLTWA
jgi:hypothetical protein